MANTEKTYALILGIVALLVGILGLLGDGMSVLGIFGVNYLQTIIHFVVAILGLYAGIWGDGDIFTQWLGWGSLLVGVLGFFGLLAFLNVNTAVNSLHVVVGIVSLVVSYSSK